MSEKLLQENITTLTYRISKNIENICYSLCGLQVDTCRCKYLLNYFLYNLSNEDKRLLIENEDGDILCGAIIFATKKIITVCADKEKSKQMQEKNYKSRYNLISSFPGFSKMKVIQCMEKYYPTKVLREQDIINLSNNIFDLCPSELFPMQMPHDLMEPFVFFLQLECKKTENALKKICNKFLNDLYRTPACILYCAEDCCLSMLSLSICLLCKDERIRDEKYFDTCAEGFHNFQIRLSQKEEKINEIIVYLDNLYCEKNKNYLNDE